MPAFPRKTLTVLTWLAGFFILWLDQLSKECIARTFALGESHPVINGIFHFSLVHNTGVAFGLFRNHNTVLSILSLAVIFYIAYDSLARKKDKSLCRSIALGLVLGGACGNLLDRIRLGYIIDFLDFRIWPVFNIADSAITAGIVLLAIELFFSRNVPHTS